MPRRTAAITGLGLVTGYGIGADALWEGMLAGESALGPIRQFDASAFPVHFASEIADDFKIRNFVPKSYRKATKVMCRDIELAVAGAHAAVADAGLTTQGSDPDTDPTIMPSRFGCQIGAGLISVDVDELTTAFATARDESSGDLSLAKWGDVGMNELTPLWLLKYLPNMLACHVTIIHDCRGPSNTITCGETAGALSIGESRRVIERDDADACFSGGAESRINPLGLVRQCHADVIAETSPDDNPHTVVRPFGTDAQGSLPGEAAAILVLEGERVARERGGRAYAHIAGFGASQSIDMQGGGLVPHADGNGLVNAIDAALRDASVSADEIDAIVPMGLGVTSWDLAEANALKRTFGVRLAQIPIITTKPFLGTSSAATSALDIAVGALCLHHQTLPARINGDNVVSGLDAGSRGTCDHPMRHLLVCSMGVGGQNAAVVLRRAE